MVSAIYDVARDVHRRSRPVISLLQCIGTGEFVQNVVFVSKVVQPLTTTVTFFSVEIDGTKEPRSRLSRGWDARLPASRIKQEGLDPFNVQMWCKIPKPFKIKFPGCACCEGRQRDRNRSSSNRCRHRHTESRIHPSDVEGFTQQFGIVPLVTTKKIA